MTTINRRLSQYIVLYYDAADELAMESFPDVYSASLWVKKHGGFILKEVPLAEVKEEK